MPIDWLPNPRPGRHLEALDAWLLWRTGSDLTTKTIYTDLAEACAGRIAVAQDKVRTTKKKQIDNLTNVAQGIADQVRPLLNARRFPENFLAEPGAAVPITLDRQAVRRVILESLLDQTTLTLTGDRGKPILKGTYSAAVAEALVRAVLLGRESFSVPADRSAAAAAVSEFLTWFDDIRLRLKAGIDESAFGTGYEERLTHEVYQRLGIDRRAGERVLPAEMTLAVSQPLTGPPPARKSPA
jgi:hypothetical protein